jgi:predicted Zn-dependent peptidase
MPLSARNDYVTSIEQDGPVIHRFANGFTVAMEKLPHLHSATAGVWVKAGSAHEQARESGVAHFLEHLFFKGTQTRTTRQIMETIEGRGGQINAFTSREQTCLHVRMLTQHVAAGIEILADIVKNSTFGDLEKERNVVLEEIASIEDTPDDYIHDLLTEQHWPGHPLGRPISGDCDSVSVLRHEDVRSFFERWYQPENMLFSIAGNFDEQAVLAQLRAEFEPMASGSIPDLGDGPAFQSGIAQHDRDIAQAHVCLAFPGPSVQNEERYLCDMVSSILGGGSTSRLFERIREDEGLAYAIYTFHSFHVHAGVIGVYVGVAPPNYKRTMDLVFEELRELREERMSAEELDMNREQIKGNLLMALESTSTRMARMAKCLLYFGRIVPVEEIVQKVDAITEDEVQAFARKIFTPGQCAMTVLGPTNGHRVKKIPL